MCCLSDVFSVLPVPGGARAARALLAQQWAGYRPRDPQQPPLEAASLHEEDAAACLPLLLNQRVLRRISTTSLGDPLCQLLLPGTPPLCPSVA